MRYFELHGFLVRQQRKYIAQTRREDEEVDFFVLNPRARPDNSALPFVLTPLELPRITRAVVVVKGWHTETFSPAVMTHAPEIFRFVEPKVFQHAAKTFGGDGSLTKILVAPALPQDEQARERSITFLREKGIDAVIPFRTMLAELVNQIETNRNYQKSDLLQIIRILKNYDFFKSPQLELFKTPRKPRRRTDKPQEQQASS